MLSGGTGRVYERDGHLGTHTNWSCSMHSPPVVQYGEVRHIDDPIHTYINSFKQIITSFTVV